ncbi:MAG: hypothetical protein IJX71_03055 [Oscillospiraceae bacterium]|nr:hypothetical protein [Oscillospiraceae bacterium]
MSRPVYRCGNPSARRTRYYLSLISHPERDCQLDSYQLALVHSMRDALTEREIQCLALYYLKERTMQEAARELGVNISTMSRNIRRGEEKLMNILRLAEKISPIRPPQSA